jgi:hypothetical protein
MFFPILGSAQLVLVTGTVSNQKTETKLENVSVFESNSGIGTITNISGFFSLMLKPGNAEIVISHEGFQNISKKLVLKSDTSLSVSMLPVLHIKSKTKEHEPQKTADKTEDAKKQ